MKKFNKIISIILIVSLISILFSACGSNEKTGSSNVQKDNSENIDTNNKKEFTYPIEGNKKLTYWVPLNGNVAQKATNLSETPLGKALEKETGVEVEYLHPSAGQEKEQFNLLVASGDYPDIVEYSIIDNYPGGPEKANGDGFIIDLTQYMPKYAPNLMKYFANHQECEKMAKTDTGNFYGFPFIRGDDELMVFFGPIVRKDWLDDLGLDLPETMEEWYTMLKEFKEKKGASAPLSYPSWMFGTGTGSPFIGAYGITKDFYLNDNGEVKFGPIQSEYKEFLQEYCKWYAEGLIDPDIETVNSTQVGAKITNGDTGVTLGYQASCLGMWLKAKKDDTKFDLEGVKFPSLKKGQKPKFSAKDFALPGTAAYITSACKDIETAMRFLDFTYSEQGHMIANFGIEGESYNMIDGYPTYTDVILNNPEMNAATGLGQYTRACYSGPMVQDARYIQQYGYQFEQQKIANKNWSISDVEKYRMPKVTPTTDESQELANIMNEINTYRDEMYVKFLFGQESLENFEEYKNNIKKMGIDRAIEIYTEALKRYNKR